MVHLQKTDTSLVRAYRIVESSGKTGPSEMASDNTAELAIQRIGNICHNQEIKDSGSYWSGPVLGLGLHTLAVIWD